MKHEYREGPEATERFEKLATQLFRAPKPIVKQAAKPEKKSKAKHPLANPLRSSQSR